MVPRVLSVSDDQSLRSASELIRDGEFEDNDLTFDDDRHIAKLVLWRADDDCRFTKRKMLFEIREVLRMQIDRDHAGTGPHPIGSIRSQSKQALIIETYDGVTISLVVDKLDATLEVTPG